MAGRNEQDQEENSITEDVRAANYYHGLLPRVDIEPMLLREGDFILRKTEMQKSIVLAVSVRYDRKVRHFMINQTEDGYFYIDDYKTRTVSDLITYYQCTGKPLSSTCEARLQRPIERPEWLLTHDSIYCKKKLGEGAFGEVYLGEINFNGELTKIAVKTMRGEVNRDARIKFMKEARLMRRFKHPNVVRIFGVAVYESPLMIVIEFCPGGDLLTYLRSHKSKLTPASRLKFITEAAKGLRYLESQKCVHRDVAARNCLLTASKDLKISDFGMSDERAIVQDDKLEKVPVKWLAKETLEHKYYTLKTDVWSYAILCWEVYADGAEPYPGLTNLQTRAKIVIQNYRMELPKNVPAEIAKIIQSCWDKDPELRPNFAKICVLLSSASRKK